MEALSISSIMGDLFDTNILIDHLNGIAKATRELKRSPDPAISIITWIEVLTGAANPDEEAIVRSFLANFTCLPLTQIVAERAVLSRRHMRLKLPDAIILATAEMEKRRLVTRNTKDFPPGLRGVYIPYKL